MNTFEQLKGRKILKILRIDTTEDYDANYTLGLIFLFNKESGLLIGIDFDHNTTTVNYSNLDDIIYVFGIEYYETYLNELKANDKLFNLVGQNLNSISIGQFIQDKYSSESFIIKTEHYAGVIIQAGDQKLTLYTTDKGKEILFNSNLLFPNPDKWVLT